ncbi:hypothetical protein dqs_3119 [Azoarcus olearius]|nr:hypothetical protein dqs_3119 [Azoarcus olearius]
MKLVRKWEFFARLVKQKICDAPWHEWVEFVAETYEATGGTTEERVVGLLAAAGFPLVRRIERAPERDSETWSLSPSNALFPVAVEKLTAFDPERRCPKHCGPLRPAE